MGLLCEVYFFPIVAILVNRPLHSEQRERTGNRKSVGQNGRVVNSVDTKINREMRSADDMVETENQPPSTERVMLWKEWKTGKKQGRGRGCGEPRRSRGAVRECSEIYANYEKTRRRGTVSKRRYGFSASLPISGCLGSSPNDSFEVSFSPVCKHEVKQWSRRTCQTKWKMKL